MGWNYRIVYHPPSTYKVGEEEFNREEYLAIHEVYYNTDGKPNAMTMDEIVTGDEGVDTLVSLKWILEHQLEALEKPILKHEPTDNIFKEIDKEKQDEFSKSIKSKE
jgi:hypothetical protein